MRVALAQVAPVTGNIEANLRTHRKVHLPTCGMFDEGRDSAAGSSGRCGAAGQGADG